MYSPDQLRDLALSALDSGQSPDEARLHLSRISDPTTATALLDGTLTGPQRDTAIAMFRRKLAENRAPESLRRAGEAQLGLIGWRELIGVVPPVVAPRPAPQARPAAVSGPPRPEHGAGRELEKLVKELGIDLGCRSCKSLAENMDRFGIAWCKEPKTIAMIAGHLRERAKGVNWWEKAKAATHAALSGVVWRIDPTRIYESLVEEAIRRAKENQPKELQ